MTLAIDILELQAGLVRVSCLSLPGCVGFGSTLEEACGQMRAAVAGYFASVRGVPPAFFSSVPLLHWN